MFSFLNNIAFGQLINLNIRQKKEQILVEKYFSDLTVYFTDKNNHFIDFMNLIVTLTFEIRQVKKV